MIDLTKVRAIAIHTHAEEPCGCHADDGYDDLQSTMARYFGAPWQLPPTIPETGYRRYPNDEVAEPVRQNDGILIPFASIDPWKGKMAVREARRLIADHGIRGFRFHPTMQGFFANDRMACPLCEVLQDHGCIALFHTGQTGVGAGMRGGNGMRLKCSSPMTMDDVAVDFPT